MAKLEFFNVGLIISLTYVFCMFISSSDALPGYIEVTLKRFENVSRTSVRPRLISNLGNNYKGTLEQIQIVFRHGDRLPDILTAYPNSPYQSMSFYPDNFGEVTYKGQRRLYNIGSDLRKRYQNFLGPQYFSNLVESISSSYGRCQMSLQALHAGLFGYTKKLPINYLHWQAFIYSIIPPNQDNLFVNFMTCPSAFNDVQYDKNITDPDLIKLMEAIRKYSGYPEPISFSKVSLIYDYLKTCDENGFAVPKEFAPFYPAIFRKGSSLEYDYATKRNVQLVAPLLQRITKAAHGKANGTLEPEDRKLFLMAGHDLNVILVMQALVDDWKFEEINYGGYVLFELHKIEGVHGFRVYLHNDYANGKPKLISISGCGTFCPLSWFDERIEKLKNEPSVCHD